MEVTLDDVPGCDRLAGRILPPGTCERALDLRGEGTEHDEDCEPRKEHDSEVRGHPTAEPSEAPGRLRRLVRLGLAQLRGFLQQ